LVTLRDILVAVPDILVAVPDILVAVPDILVTVRDILVTVPDILLAVPDILVTVPDILVTVPDILITVPDIQNSSNSVQWGRTVSYRLADRQTHMAKLIVAIRICFAREAKNVWGRPSTVPHCCLDPGPQLLGSHCHRAMLHVAGCQYRK
jgi:hypothetical protein